MLNTLTTSTHPTSAAVQFCLAKNQFQTCYQMDNFFPEWQVPRTVLDYVLCSSCQLMNETITKLYDSSNIMPEVHTASHSVAYLSIAS